MPDQVSMTEKGVYGQTLIMVTENRHGDERKIKKLRVRSYEFGVKK